MTDILSSLPPQLAEIAELIGVANAVRLAAEFGGVELYVPKHPVPAQKITRCIGLEAARALALIYGGGRIEMPLAAGFNRSRVHARIVAAVAGGRSKSAIARELKMTTRGIRKIANRRRARDTRQGELI